MILKIVKTFQLNVEPDNKLRRQQMVDDKKHDMESRKEELFTCFQN